jgi:Domain of unknown function (DUF4282)
MGAEMGDFLKFETMITPIIIQILFWLGVLISVAAGIVILIAGGDNSVLVGLGFIILGPVLTRIYAEVLIVFFRINDHLRHIDYHTQPGVAPPG